MPVKNKHPRRPVDRNHQDENDLAVCWIQPGEHLRAGMTCPRCQQGQLDYNGLLQLTCPVCGMTEMGACT
jgi:uncharacterized protein (DUF983 family)